MLGFFHVAYPTMLTKVCSEIMRQPWPPQSKMFLGIPLPVYKPGKFPFFITKLSGGRHDSANFAEKVIFPKFLAYHPLCEQILCESAAYEPQASTARQWWARGKADATWTCRLCGYCPDPKLITEPKTFHIQRISTLLGLKDSCHSHR